MPTHVPSHAFPELGIEGTVVAGEVKDDVFDVGEYARKGIEVAGEVRGTGSQGVDGGERYGRILEHGVVEHYLLKGVVLAGFEERACVSLFEEVEVQRAKTRQDAS
ncbi:hypothetical protein GSI_15456 [Ganoderma sinense ZZ0214-1]|uniref:Uncharacterized protein n=1 Tax=Ganoderma sinense ZZ0214-1 TaxID=1077348 RepID=A0A2G8RMM3_9APHY|nr:hypothetical protein GSI_15456 [Ganoderma sinense ZZ0214-1]